MSAETATQVAVLPEGVIEVPPLASHEYGPFFKCSNTTCFFSLFQTKEEVGGACPLCHSELVPGVPTAERLALMHETAKAFQERVRLQADNTHCSFLYAYKELQVQLARQKAEAPGAGNQSAKAAAARERIIAEHRAKVRAPKAE